MVVKWQSHSIVEAGSDFTCCASIIDKVSVMQAGVTCTSFLLTLQL